MHIGIHMYIHTIVHVHAAQQMVTCRPAWQLLRVVGLFIRMD